MSFFLLNIPCILSECITTAFWFFQNYAKHENFSVRKKRINKTLKKIQRSMQTFTCPNQSAQKQGTYFTIRERFMVRVHKPLNTKIGSCTSNLDWNPPLFFCFISPEPFFFLSDAPRRGTLSVFIDEGKLKENNQLGWSKKKKKGAEGVKRITLNFAEAWLKRK